MDKEKKIEEKKEETPVVSEEKTACCGMKCSRGSSCSKPGIKSAIIVAVVIILGALAYYNRSFFVAATVDGYPIGRFTVMQESEKQAGKTTLDGLILKMIVTKEAERQGIVVNNDEVLSEMKKIEDAIKTQGGTLEQALSAQGITKEELGEQIMLQKKVEKLIPSKPVATDEDIKAFIASNKITIPKGQEVEYLTKIKTQIEQQKLQQAIQSLVTSLKEKVNVNYFVKY